MYKIFADGSLMHSPDLQEDGFIVEEPVLEKDSTKAGYLEFKITPSNPFYDKIRPYKTTIVVTDDNKEKFRGRILTTEKDMNNVKSVHCEGALSFFLDTRVIPELIPSSGNLYTYIRYLVENCHNPQVRYEWDPDRGTNIYTNKKMFSFRSMTVKDPVGDVNWQENANYQSTKEALDAIIDTYGGYFVVTYNPEAETKSNIPMWFLDYLEDIGVYSGQEINFGENLLDLTETENPENIFTAVIPIGYDEEGNRVDASPYYNSPMKTFIWDTDSVAKYGVIVESITYSGVIKDPFDLARLAKLTLKRNAVLNTRSLEINAIDLSLLGADVSEIDIGSILRVYSKPHNIDNYEVCNKITMHLDDPSQNEYVFGDPPKDLTDFMVEDSTSLGLAMNIDDFKIWVTIDRPILDSYTGALFFMLESDGPVSIEHYNPWNGETEYEAFYDGFSLGGRSIDEVGIGNSNYALYLKTASSGRIVSEVTFHGKITKFKAIRSNMYGGVQHTDDQTPYISAMSPLPTSLMNTDCQVRLGESGIRVLYSDLFSKWNPWTTISAKKMFMGCETLVNIMDPTVFFDELYKMHEINDITSMFEGCRNLAIEMPALWDLSWKPTLYENFAKDCIKLTNYLEIPEDWGGSPPIALSEFKMEVTASPYESKNQKCFILPLWIRTVGRTEIDWGDGSDVLVMEDGVWSSNSYSSMMSAKTPALTHYYDKNTGTEAARYIITIKGIITWLDVGTSIIYNYYSHSVEVPQRNVTNYGSSSNRTRITGILSPLQETMIRSAQYPDNVVTFDFATSIHTVPENLFENAANLTGVAIDNMFNSSPTMNVYKDPRTTFDIPEKLFEPLKGKIRSADRVFFGRTDATYIPPLWDGTYGYIAYHNQYATNCTNASNYEDVPDDWK